MPLTITVNRSAKVTKDYNSQGYGLSLEAELPAELIHDPSGVADAANHLFQLAEDLLAEQVKSDGPAPKAQPTPRTSRSNGRGRGNHNGNGNGHSKSNGRHAATREPRLITQAQTKALHNMCDRLGYDPAKVAHEEFGTPLPDLTIKQASDLIDILKDEFKSQPATSNA